MTFPLRAWIDAHAGAPHDLAASGMGPTLAAARRALAAPRPPDAVRLRRELARAVGVPAERLFLTHGATEGNTLVLVHLARRRPATFRVGAPEYPALPATARGAGLAPVRGRAGVGILTDPHNPTGRPVGPAAFAAARASARALLVDETFREFGRAPSRARADDDGVFVTGTFTKAYGADAIRVGFVVVPTAEIDAFAAWHGVALDDLPAASVGAARALLAARPAILAETRRRVVANLAYLAERRPDLAGSVAPVAFDRLPHGGSGDRLARRLLRRGILVCPGSFFGTPGGVRLGATRTGFPRDLDAYLAARGNGGR